MTNDISIGAIGAALIAGIISLLGLIVSKEQKVSEFRQSWVDAVRVEITSYLTSINAISDALQIVYKDQAEKIDRFSPLYSKLNESYFTVILRLNNKEQKSKVVIDHLDRFMQLVSHERDVNPANIRPIEKDLISATKDLLKYEWNRVKSGELTFRFTKYCCELITFSALLYILYSFFNGYHSQGMNLLNKQTKV